MRTVQLDMNAVDMTELVQTTGTEEFNKALGYLSQWNMTFPYVRIAIASTTEPELVAMYYQDSDMEGRRPGYVIGAVWHGDHFGFHS